MNKQKYREFTPGLTVKLTGNYLISTGQRVGGEGLNRWTILSCSCSLCKTGRFIAVNQSSTTEWTKEELELEPGIANRHLSKESVSIVGQVDIRNCGDVYVGITMEGLIKGHTKEGSREIKEAATLNKPKSQKQTLNLDDI